MRFLESVAPGDVVEVVGILDQGAFAPTIIAIDLVVRGTAPMPEARPIDPNRLFGGADNGRRVILPGIVQGYREAGRWWHLVVDSAGHRLVAQVPKASLDRDPAELVDAEVRLTGVAGSIRNTRGEFLLPRLCIARSADVEVVTPRHAEAFEAPRVSLSAIAGYRADPAPGHRVRTSGVVTLAIPGRFFYLQEGLEGVRVETATNEPLAAGDVVDVAGFIRMRHGLGTLTESVFRVTSRTQPPRPMDLQPAEMLAVNLRAHKRGMPGMGGLESLRRILGIASDAKVLVLTSSESAADARLAMQTGACGYLTKNVEHAEIVAMIRAAHAGRRDICRGVPVASDTSAPAILSPREFDVLHLLRRGSSNQEISRALGITERTVKAHVMAIMEKFGAPDRAGAVAKGFDLGILRAERRD